MKHKHFFIIGAQRSGTTLLYKKLNNHPLIEMATPLKPEPKYFLRDIDFDYEHYKNNFFANAKVDQLLGEKSTSYYESPVVARKIKAAFPNAKIICLLRNPAERAISNYFFTKSFGLETRSLEEVFIKNIAPPKLHKNISVNPFNYLGRGHYWSFLAPYIEVFGLNQVHVCLFEELIKSKNCIEQVFNFLEIEPLADMQFELKKKINSAERDVEYISNDIWNYLYDYFEESNSQLRQALQLNLLPWKKL